MLVLIRHTPVVPGVGDSVLERGFHFVQTAGWIGVDLFFVLSGFLIAGLLFHEIDGTGRLRLKRFWLRRGLKIWPSYFAAYGAAWLLSCLWAGYRGDHTALFKLLRDFVPNALFVQNYVSCERWPHSWTLAVEEHFYIVLPILLALCYRSRSVSQRPALKSVVALWLLFATAICSWRLLNASTGVSWSVNYYRSHLRADSLMFGVFLSWLHRNMSLSGRTIRVLTAAAIPLVVAAFILVNWFPLDGPVTSTVGFTFLYAVGGLLVLLAAIFPNAGETWPRPVRVLVRGLSWIGVYSYTFGRFRHSRSGDGDRSYFSCRARFWLLARQCCVAQPRGFPCHIDPWRCSPVMEC
jgi:peptidoglycan/LPS O-acetylase OafA/YrhL